MNHVYHFLVANGLFRTIINWTVGFLLGLLVSRLRSLRFMGVLKDIDDKLDTSSPGGLTDIHNELKNINQTDTDSPK